MDLLDRASRFRGEVFAQHSGLYQRLASDGQNPRTLMISCADSRVVPEQITQAAPGELFVCRNAGNIVPPFSQANGGVSSTVEYAVMVLGVRDIVVCGHSDCGAMKAVSTPEVLENMPNVAAWLRHSQAARSVVCDAHPHLDGSDRARAIALEATLSFLGLGVPITEPSLGLLISNGYEYMLSGKYWISFYPGIALLVTIVSINLVGDHLRDVLNPRLQK